MRDKLAELLGENFAEFCHVDIIAGDCKIKAVTLDVDKFADHLIAKGVTLQKHGRWLDGICTNCGVEALEYVDEEGDWLVYTTDHCPNCGAKMDAFA